MNMTETITIKKIYNEIKDIKKDVSFIKKHVFDIDNIMTLEESKRFEKSMKELKAGKTTSLSQVKKELRF